MIIQSKYFHGSLNIVVILALGHTFFSAKCAQFSLTFLILSFFFGTVIIHSWDKPCQETNLKSHLNSILFCKSGKILTDLQMSHFILIFVCAHFCNEIERCQLWKSLQYCSILRPMKNDIRFEYDPWKYCFISTDLVHFSHKTEKFRF